MAERNTGTSFHEGFNLPKPGAYQVDLTARRLQESAEIINVSISKKIYRKESCSDFLSADSFSSALLVVSSKGEGEEGEGELFSSIRFSA